MTWSVVVRSKREQRLMNALLNAEEPSSKGQGKGKSKGKGRTGPAAAESSRKPEWTCRSCQTPNFMNREECRRCGDARMAKGKGKGSSTLAKPQEVSKTKIKTMRQEMDYKAAMMRHSEEEEEAEEEGDAKMATGEGYGETEEENELDTALLELEKEDESELKSKLKNVEHVLIQAKSVSLTEGMEELERRAALYRLAIRRKQPDGEQLDQAKQLWERAQALRDKQETKIQQLQESLNQAKDKLKLQEKQVEAAKAAYEEVRMKLQNPKPVEAKTAASADPGEVTQKTLTALAAKVPAFEGAITAGELHDLLLNAMHQTADEMKGNYTAMERWEMKPVTFQFGVAPEKAIPSEPVAPPPAPKAADTKLAKMLLSPKDPLIGPAWVSNPTRRPERAKEGDGERQRSRSAERASATATEAGVEPTA